MNTSRIGFIGLPDVASRFQDEGFTVVTGETVLSSAQAIRRAISEKTDSDSPLPVIVEDQHQSGLAGLLTRLQRAAGEIVIVRSGESFLPSDWVDLPRESTLLEYATAAGVPATEALGLLDVQSDGSIVEREPEPAPAAEESLDDLDFGFDELDPAPAPVAEVEDDDPFADLDVAEPEPAPVATPAPEPVVETTPELDASETVDPFASDPTPEPAPAPAAPVAVEEDDLFGDLGDQPAEIEEDDLRDSARPAARPVARPVSPIAGPDEDDLDTDISESEIGPAENVDTAPRRTVSKHRAAELSPSVREQMLAEEDAPGRPADEAPRRRRRVLATPVAETESVRRDTGDFLDEIEQGNADDPDLRADLDDDDDDDDDMLLGRNARRTTRARSRSARGRAPVIINGAGKGGVGKTSLTIALGQRAAVRGRLDVCVIDMNRGQGDVSGFLKLRKSDLPTIFEAAQLGDISKAFLSPSRLEAVRGDSVEHIAFTLVSAPKAKDAEASRSVVTDRVYRQAIDYARDNFDLVVIDTQIIESTDTSGLITGAVIPLLAQGAYFVGITDQSRTGTDNLVDHVFRRFPKIGDQEYGGAITSRNFVTVVNRMSRDVATSGFERKFGQMSHFAGAIPHDDRVRDLLNAGHVPHEIPSVARVLDQILYRVTGDDEFHPDATSGRDEEEEGAQKVGFFRRLFGRG